MHHWKHLPNTTIRDHSIRLQRFQPWPFTHLKFLVTQNNLTNFSHHWSTTTHGFNVWHQHNSWQVDWFFLNLRSFFCPVTVMFMKNWSSITSLSTHHQQRHATVGLYLICQSINSKAFEWPLKLFTTASFPFFNCVRHERNSICTLCWVRWLT